MNNPADADLALFRMGLFELDMSFVLLSINTEHLVLRLCRKRITLEPLYRIQIKYQRMKPDVLESYMIKSSSAKVP